ncbi:MAG: glycosyl hydrolase family 28-related protein, partial [Verrucomicrobia bacterium]|nr:glycosyl hydrolase family 28-related protein [Verrucomicrobiota bacterium]
MKKKIILLVFNLWFLTCNAPGGVINVSDYGALGDGKTVNTDAIQKAIDDCHESGGGKLLFSNGNYVTGTIFLKSNVILHIEAGASLSGSTNISDYSPNVFRNQYAREPHMDRCLIFAENANNIGIEGRGTVNGQERARGHIFILDRKQGSDLGMED